jgi:ribokinase
MVVAGSLNMDLFIRSPRMPQPGETVISGEYQNVPEGSDIRIKTGAMQA